METGGESRVWSSRETTDCCTAGGNPVRGVRGRCGTASRFRGPNGSGVATDQQPPIEIGPEKNVQWKVPAPVGLSSPIIVSDTLVITAVQDGSLYTIAYIG
jgi:hypothetical protein